MAHTTKQPSGYGMKARSNEGRTICEAMESMQQNDSVFETNDLHWCFTFAAYDFTTLLRFLGLLSIFIQVSPVSFRDKPLICYLAVPMLKSKDDTVQQPWAFLFSVMLWCASHFSACMVQRCSKPPYSSGCFHGITIGIFQWFPAHSSGFREQKAKRKAKSGAGDTHQIVEVPNCEQIFRQICHHLNFSEITGNIAPPRNLNCLNIVNLYGSQHNRNFGLKKYHKSPTSWQVPLSIAVYFPSQKNSKQFCFFHVVFLSSLSSPAPWAPLLELPLSSAAEAEDHVLWRLSNFNLEKSKNSKFHVLKLKCGNVQCIENVHVR